MNIPVLFIYKYSIWNAIFNSVKGNVKYLTLELAVKFVYTGRPL